MLSCRTTTSVNEEFCGRPQEDPPVEVVEEAQQIESELDEAFLLYGEDTVAGCGDRQL